MSDEWLNTDGTPKRFHLYSGRAIRLFLWSMLAGAGALGSSSSQVPQHSSTPTLLVSMAAGVGLIAGLVLLGLRLFTTEPDSNPELWWIFTVAAWVVFALFAPVGLWSSADDLNDVAMKEAEKSPKGQ